MPSNRAPVSATDSVNCRHVWLAGARLLINIRMGSAPSAAPPFLVPKSQPRAILVPSTIQAVKEGPRILDVPHATGIENALRSTAQRQKSLGRQLRSLPFDPLQH